jgi:outer membrane protein assembly factor BamB
VDAQPLYVSGLNFPRMGARNVVFIETEHGSAYAFDADTGAKLWQISTLKAGETTSDSQGCSQVVPEIGITATPVIDLKAGPHGTIYIVAMSKDGAGR